MQPLMFANSRLLKTDLILSVRTNRQRVEQPCLAKQVRAYWLNGGLSCLNPEFCAASVEGVYLRLCGSLLLSSFFSF